MKVGIVGFGVVGRALARFFRRSPSIELNVYDKFVSTYASRTDLLLVNQADIVFVAVPTPFDEATQRCDISAVEEVVDSLSAPVCIKSTVPPGTTDTLIRLTGKNIAFGPEYLGESPSHPWPEIDDCGFAIFGGDATACGLALEAYRYAARRNLQYVETSALAAEIAKYMENTYLAMKVSFVNQFYDVAAAANVDFAELRRIFVLDSRVGESHTNVSPERGFGGKCLPKDLRSILAWARANGVSAPLLESILSYNESVRSLVLK